MLKNKLIYFPSFSVGSFGNDLVKDYKIKDVMPIRFYDQVFNELTHPNFLITAGHFYKKKDARKKYGVPDSSLLMGDSGGFQIATGALEYSKDLVKKIFHWLEDNADVSINLDIPPRHKYAGKFQDCLNESYNNFKYFYENQTGKTDFLNVLQGENETEFQAWYKMASEFQFQGWSIGGIAGSIYKMIAGLITLLNNKEHLKTNNKYLHILGTSKILDFALLLQIQKSLNDIGSNITITTDSSTPSRQVVYGGYHVGPDFKTMNFRMVHIPKIKDYVREKELEWFGYSSIDYLLTQIIKFDELFKFDHDAYNAIVLHNLYVFIDTIKTIETYIDNRSYLINDYTLFPSDVEKLLNVVDEIIKSDKPSLIFDKYKPFIMSMNRQYSDDIVNSDKLNEFFTF